MQPHSVKKPSQTQILLDQSWVSNQMDTPKNLIQCPICFHIAFQPIQCQKCQRIICKEDYEGFKKVKDCCPLCKTTPWKIRDTVHIAYRDIMSKLIFNCQICADDNKYTEQKLRQHLKADHNLRIKSNICKLYKYTLQQENNGAKKIIQLNKIQILQILFNQNVEKLSEFTILDKKLGLIHVNLKSSKFGYKDANGTATLGQVVKQQLDLNGSDPLSSELDPKNQCTIWYYQQFSKKVFFCEDQQTQIQAGYKQFTQNTNLCQIHLDHKKKDEVLRYRIMFDEMKQINLKTKFQRTIGRVSGSIQKILGL